MKSYISKVLSVTLSAALVVFGLYFTVEPSLSSAATASDTVVITLNVTSGITISSPPDSSMSRAVAVGADTATGSTTWNVKTNNVLGYTLAIHATSSPAMASASSTIQDFATSAPALWSTSAGTAKFGYSARGTDVNTSTWGTDSDCWGATQHDFSTGLKYKGFWTADTNIAVSAATSSTSGTDTMVCYAVEENAFYIPSGTYQATIVATATTN